MQILSCILRMQILCSCHTMQYMLFKISAIDFQLGGLDCTQIKSTINDLKHRLKIGRSERVTP
jgi:hypothetical protein